MSSTRTLAIGIGLVLTALLAVGPGTSALAAPPLADKVPEGALVYVGWGGRSLTFDGSTFGQLLSEPFVKDVLGAVHKAASSEIGDEDDRAIFNHLWTMGSIAWRHPAALALYEIVPPGEGAGGGDDPRPIGALVIDLQKDRPAFATELGGLLALAGKKLEIAQVAAGEVTYSRFDTPAGACGLGFVGDLFFMTVGEKAPATVVALAAGKARTLSADPGFAAAMKEVAGEAVQMVWYVDVVGAIKTMEKLTPPAEEPGARTPLQRALDAVGLDRATVLVGATNIVDRGCHEKVRLLSPAPHRGVLAPLAGAPLAATVVAGVPADADIAAVVRCDPSAMLAELRRSLAAFDPDLVKQVDSALATVGEELEMDVEKDLIAAIGDQWTFVSAPSLGGALTGTALTVELKDPAKAAAAIARVEKVLGEAIGRPASEDRRARGMGIHTLTSGELTIRYIAAIGRGDPWPVAPAWAIHKNRLIVAAWPQVVVAAAEKPARSLADQPGFAALRKRVSPNASIVTYTNSPALLQRFYGVGLVGWTMAGNALAGEVGPVLSPAQLPPLSKLNRYASENISAVSADAKGVTLEAYGALPGGGLFGWLLNTSPTQGLAVAALMPALAHTRSRARETMVASQLRNVAMCCQMHAADHEGRFPPDLESLTESGMITEQFLKQERGGKFIYLGATLGEGAPARLILAYFLPDAGLGDPVTAACRDGSVQMIPRTQFDQDLAKTQKYIKDQGK